MSEDTVAILERARKLISDPKNWIKGSYDNDEFAPQAWCATGALCYVLGKEPSEVEYKCDVYDLLDDEARRLHKRRVNQVNDQLGHEATLALYDATIQLARGDA